MVMNRLMFTFLFTIVLSGCSYMLPKSGPSTITIVSKSYIGNYITLVKLDPVTASKISSFSLDLEKKLKFFKTAPYSPRLDKGDVVEIFIYETPPSVLFSSIQPSPPSLSSGISSFTVPAQIVDEEGYINVPFVGRVYVKGKTPDQVAREIEKKLQGKANNPQVIVRLLEFRSSYVTVLGHVAQSKIVPLSYSVKTILDVLGAVGGVTSPIKKTVVKISRNGKEIEIPLEDILKNPSLNINLKPGDKITVMYKTKSAVFLGASGKNEELEFEAKGIDLSQALGRVGGLRDDKAHAKGLFIFRFENPKVLEKIGLKPKAFTRDGKVPVVYNIDMSEPTSIFTLKNFQLKDGDIIYIATAPSVQYQKFLQILVNTISPVFMIERMTR